MIDASAIQNAPNVENRAPLSVLPVRSWMRPPTSCVPPPKNNPTPTTTGTHRAVERPRR